jgi:PAS domain S-box-containing protein
MPDTAIALLSAALALALAEREGTGGRRRLVSKAAAIIALVVGLVTVFEYSTGVDSRINHWIFSRPIPIAKGLPPFAGMCLIAIGSALLLIDKDARQGGRPSEWLALAVLPVVMVSLLTYAFRSTAQAPEKPWTGIAIPTGIALGALAIGILAARPDRGLMAFVTARDSLASMILRRTLPFAICVPLIGNGIRALAEQEPKSRQASALQAVAAILIYSAITWALCRVIRKFEIGRNRANDELLHYRDELEERVRERTIALHTTINALERAMDSIRASEERARSIFDNVADGIIVLDTDGVIESVNPAVEKTFGYTIGELIGRDVAILTAPDERGEPNGGFADYCRTGIGRNSRLGREFDGLRRDGSKFPAEISLGEFRQSGRLYITGVIHDVSARKAAEENLRERLELARRLTAIAESAPGLLYSFRIDANGSMRVPFATRAITEIFGFTSEILAKDLSPVLARVHPDDRDALLESVAASRVRDTPCHAKYRYCHPTKGERHIEGWSRTHPDEHASDGSVTWHGFIMDVTDRELAEAAQRESERLARSVLDSLPSHIAVVDESGRITNINRAWRDFAASNGALESAAVGANYFDACERATPTSIEIASEVAAGIKDVLAGWRSEFELEYPCHAPDQSRWFVVRVSPFVKGGPRRVVVAHDDISARKIAEITLADRERMLAESQRMAHVGSWEVEFDERSGQIRDELRWSDECYRIFGYEPGQVAATYELFASSIPAEDRELVSSAIARTLSGDAPYNVEHRIVRPNGSVGVVQAWGEIAGTRDAGRRRLAGTCQDITERKEAENALRESEERLTLATSSAQLGTWDSDLITGLTKWSTRQQEIFGFAASEFDGTIEAFQRRVHPDDVESLRQAIARSRTGSGEYRHEYRVLLPDGSVRWVAGAGRTYFNAAGAAIRMAGISHDITERKLAEEALHETRERLAMACESGGIGTWDLDLTTNRVTWSPRQLAIFGLTADDLDGSRKTFLEHIHPDDREGMAQAMDRARASRERYEHEYRIILKDGSIRWISSLGQHTYDESGRPISFAGVSQDVTRRKQAEEALRESEEFNRQIIADLQEGLYVLDGDLRYRVRNRFLETLTGISNDDCLGKRPDDVFPELRSLGVVAAHERALLGETVVSPDLPFGLAAESDDRPRWMTERAFPLRNARGQVVGVIGTTLDITDRRRAEDAQRLYAARLENLHRIDLAMIEARTPRELALAALRQLELTVPIWCGRVILIDSARMKIEVAAETGRTDVMPPPVPWTDLEAAERTDLEILRRGRLAYSDDLQAAVLADRPYVEGLRTNGMRSYLIVPMMDRGALSGVLCLGADRPHAYSSTHQQVCCEVAAHLAIAIRQAFLFQENRSAKDRVEKLSRRLIEAEEKERRRIARELHDEIGQALTALKVNLQELVEGRGDFSERKRESDSIVERLLGQVRGVALDLRPSLLDDLGLAEAIAWYARKQAERTGLRGKCVVDPERIKADPEIETACFRVAQEALTNVARHARATRFSVELLQHSGGLSLIVRDDGTGFDVAAKLAAAAQGASFGLAGMKERVELLGGSLAVISDSDSGTEIQVEFPNTPLVANADIAFPATADPEKESLS